MNNLAKGVFSGGAREMTYKQSAIRVSYNFWITKWVICKIPNKTKTPEIIQKKFELGTKENN